VIDMWEIIVAVLLVVALYFWYKYRSLKKDFEEKVRRSSLVLSGKYMEKSVPFLETFPYDAHDMRWLGDPIDFVIFDGSSKGDVDQIVFCEVKTGKSTLSNVQRKIKELIENKKVKWEEFRVK